MFKTFFTNVPAFFKAIPGKIKNIPTMLKDLPKTAKSVWHWIQAFATIGFPVFVKNLCASIKVFITPAAVK